MTLTLRNKIRFSFLAIILLLSVFTMFFFPARQRDALRSSFEVEVEGTVETVALGATIGLKSGDLSATQKAFEFAKTHDDLRFVALLSEGNAIAAYPENVVLTSAMLESDTIVVKRAPVEADGFRGEAIVGFSTASIDRVSMDLTLTAAGVTLLAILFGAFCAWRLERSIRRPLRNLSEGARKIGSGDLTIEMTYGVDDEIGQLYRAIGEMTNRLHETISSVMESSKSVADASIQISSSTEQMAAGSQEQTSQTSEAASAMEEMTRTIMESCQNATSAAETARVAKETAEAGGKVVEETVEGMRNIASVVNTSAATVRALGKSSDQIGEIIDVIDDIADQTNLLALNAAIEAARAGDQGRGFAVVADEVRKLAERTTKATKEIATMIKKIQADTRGAVDSMEVGTRKVDEGIALADKAGVALREIVSISQKVTDMVSHIAAAGEEQSTTSEQISKNVEAISAVASQTAAGTQLIARAAEDLNRLTETLKSLVAQFTLKAGEEHDMQSDPAQPHPFKGQISNLAVRHNGALVPHNS